jgi:Flp pilus assembly protein TadD
MLRTAHPMVPLSEVLRGEERFARAHASLSEGRYPEAALHFQSVLELAPDHYPSWAHLGAAYLGLDRRAEARNCLERALKLQPGYAVARQNMALLDGSPS